MAQLEGKKVKKVPKSKELCLSESSDEDKKLPTTTKGKDESFNVLLLQQSIELAKTLQVELNKRDNDIQRKRNKITELKAALNNIEIMNRKGKEELENNRKTEISKLDEEITKLGKEIKEKDEVIVTLETDLRKQKAWNTQLTERMKELETTRDKVEEKEKDEVIITVPEPLNMIQGLRKRSRSSRSTSSTLSREKKRENTSDARKIRTSARKSYSSSRSSSSIDTRERQSATTKNARTSQRLRTPEVRKRSKDTRRTGRCYCCNKTGHRARDCPARGGTRYPPKIPSPPPLPPWIPGSRWDKRRSVAPRMGRR